MSWECWIWLSKVRRTRKLPSPIRVRALRRKQVAIRSANAAPGCTTRFHLQALPLTELDLLNVWPVGSSATTKLVADNGFAFSKAHHDR